LYCDIHRLSDTAPAAASTADSVIEQLNSSAALQLSSARSSAALQLRALKCTPADAATSVLTSALTVQASLGPITATVTRQLVCDTAACVARQRSSAARQHGFSNSSSRSSSVDNSATAANGSSDAPKADVGDPSAPPWQIVLQQISIECEAAASGDSSAATATAGVLAVTDAVLHYSAQNSDDSSVTAAQIEVLARNATTTAATAADTDNTAAVHTDTALVCIADVIMSRESAPDAAAAAAAADTTAAGDLQQEPLFTAHATAGSVHAVISPQLMALVSSVRSHMQCFSASELLQRRDSSATTIDAAASATATAATSSRACQSVLVQASEVTVSTDGGASKRGTAANVSISLLYKHSASAASMNSSTVSSSSLEVAVGQQYVCVIVDKPGQPLQVRTSIFE
jgi:hypothetical protein